MKAAEITGKGSVEVVERPIPVASGDLVVVKILVAPMCTEFKKRQNGTKDTSLGHEAVGVITDAGDSRRFQIGDRVAVMPHHGCGMCYLCTSGDYMHCTNQRDVLAETGQTYGTATYSQYLVKPNWLVLHIPSDISLIHAAMSCCGFGPTFGALQRMSVDALDVLLVSGCGPVGLGAVAQGVTRRARVFAIETHPYRTELAYRLGAERVFNPIEEDVPSLMRELTGRGADAGIETSGAPTAAKTLALSIRPRGKLAVVAWAGDVVFPPLVPQGLDIFGVWHWNSLVDVEEMWRTIRQAGDLIDILVTHVMPLQEVSAAMDIQDTGSCGKILLLPNGDPQDESVRPT